MILIALILPNQSLANRLVVKPRCDQGNEVCGARVERECRLSIEPRNIVEWWSITIEKWES